MNSRQSKRGPRSSRRAEQRSGQGGRRSGVNATWLWIGGVAALLIGLVVFGVVRSIPGTTASDFDIVAYQGQETLGGNEVNFLSLLDQGKPVILNFWAGLCPPCRAEMPDFQKVYDELGDQFILVGVDVGPFTGLGSHEDARQFLQEFNITYPTGFAEDATPVRKYGVQSMPTTVFITPEGEITRNWQGLLSENNMRAQLQLLMQASAAS